MKYQIVINVVVNNINSLLFYTLYLRIIALYFGQTTEIYNHNGVSEESKFKKTFEKI